MAVDIYQFKDYVSFIKAYVKTEKNNWGLWAKLAKAAGCRPTYLSQVMKEKAQLTPDHVLGIARYMQLSENETDFFLLLLELARAGTKALRDYTLMRIQRIQKERENIAKRFDRPQIESGEKETLYYSAWFWSALHVIVSIPEYQTVNAISQRLALPPDFVLYALQKLETHGIVKQVGTTWKLGTADVHVPKDSMMIGMHHSNWKQRAVQDSLMPMSSGLHFTGIYSLSRSDYQHLKEKMLDLIEHARKIVGPSREEEIICFSCDLFPV